MVDYSDIAVRVSTKLREARADRFAFDTRDTERYAPPHAGSSRQMSLADAVAPGASGIDQLRAMIAAGGKAAIGETLQFQLLEASDGRAVFGGLPGAHAYNPIGTVHGGYAATLLDSACGCAVHSKLTSSQAYTTLELKVAYHRPLTTETGPVRAEGRVISFGRRVAFAEASLTDADGRLYASATSTLMVFER